MRRPNAHIPANKIPANTWIIYREIIAYKVRNDGISPTHAEIAASAMMTKSAIAYHLDILEDLKLITRPRRGHSRSIQIIGGTWLPPYFPALPVPKMEVA
jgi:DNA-binding transcriptional ArsR family regulator